MSRLDNRLSRLEGKVSVEPQTVLFLDTEAPKAEREQIEVKFRLDNGLSEDAALAILHCHHNTDPPVAFLGTVEKMLDYVAKQVTRLGKKQC